eukprot:TRINITY_DN8209_c0_g1_i5.p2 TRINITY_DN8209_c0_g1~~TRINITY_DN8209_c0_g1_i5.p2  ORF type:complete len:168 (-),score=37.31 TRINITY_DN8209_c0_g1_i5:202-705(-)
MCIRDRRYYIGGWRRAPFSPNSDPQTLAVNGNSVCLSGFEADSTLWRVMKLDNGQYALKSAEMTDSYLGADLEMKSGIQEAAHWSANTYPAFRGGPYDVSVQFCNIHGQILCANEGTRQVAILSVEEAGEVDAQGNFVWNDAWECSPDLDEEADDEHLKNYLERSEL